MWLRLAALLIAAWLVWKLVPILVLVGFAVILTGALVPVTNRLCVIGFSRAWAVSARWSEAVDGTPYMPEADQATAWLQVSLVWILGSLAGYTWQAPALLASTLSVLFLTVLFLHATLPGSFSPCSPASACSARRA